MFASTVFWFIFVDVEFFAISSEPHGACNVAQTRKKSLAIKYSHLQVGAIVEMVALRNI